MYRNDRLSGLFKDFSGRRAQPPSLLQKIVAGIGAVVVFGLALMFSVVFFAIVVTVGIILWAYVWWTSRKLRRSQGSARPDGLVIEGEVIREVPPHERRPGSGDQA